MNAKQEAREPVARYLATPPLLQHFDRVAQAPGGVARLRELILTLAVQGKLVPQDPADEPASVLLERIREEKARLVKEGTIRKEKPLEEIADHEKPFELPESWEWTRLGNVCQYIQRGKSPAYADVSEHRVVSQKCVRWNGLDIAPARFITPDSLDRYEEIRFLQSGDMLWNSTGTGTIGRACLIPPDLHTARLVADSHVTVVRSLHLSATYLWRWVQSPFVQNEIEGSASGSTNQIELSTATVINHLVPLPPLAEQSRIVARVEELMALCDVLEEKGRLAAAQHERLAGALFDALANSASAEEAAEHWQRIAAHFDLLLDRPAAVDRLEQAILQLAVRGRLVPQNSADEPASALLQKIRTEKDRLVATGQLKRDKPLPPVSDKEKLFELPEGWGFVSFPELCVIGGGATPSKAKPMYWEGDLPWVSPKDMKVDFISDAQDHVSKFALEETRLPLVPKSSLLIVVRGMILAHSFPVGVTQVEVTINQDMKSLTPLYPALTPYLALVCKGFKQEILELVERSSHGTCKLESDKLFAFRFGLPPLAEQSRIVARVAELRALCVQLRDRLATTARTRSRLAEALLEQAVT